MPTLPRMRLMANLYAAFELWLDRERDRLALWLAVFMGAGVIAYYDLRTEPAIWVGAAAFLPVTALSIRAPDLGWLFAPAAAVALGFTAAQFATARAPPIETDLPSKAS